MGASMFSGGEIQEQIPLQPLEISTGLQRAPGTPEPKPPIHPPILPLYRGETKAQLVVGMGRKHEWLVGLNGGSGRGSPADMGEEAAVHPGGVGEPWAQLRGAPRNTLRLSKWALC